MKNIQRLASWAHTRFFVFMLMLLAVLSAPKAHAAWDTDITDIVTDATTFFTSIKGLVITVVVFGIAIGFTKLIKKK